MTETRDAFPIRLSHLLRHCSVGAIVRGQRYLVAVVDTRQWYRNGQAPRESEILYVNQIRASLGIDQRLCAPPVGVIDDSGEISSGHWIPVVRFPTWMLCPRCGLLHSRPWKHLRPDDKLVCEGREGRSCGMMLEQAPWIIAHESGHMADVPWHSLAHASSKHPDQISCRPDWNSPYLVLGIRSTERTVECTRCSASNRLQTRLKFPDRSWQQPWITTPPPAEGLEVLAWLLEVNDVRVHAAINSTALVIPPESRIRRGTVVDRLYTNSNKQRELRRAGPELPRKRILKETAREWRCTPDEIEAALREIDNGYPTYGKACSQDDLMRGEFAALAQPVDDFFEDEDFVTKHRTDAWATVCDKVGFDSRKRTRVIDRLVEVRRLKEIVVLRGFSRLGGEEIVPPDITGETGWLPAIELRGEGIFFTLDESLLDQWARQPGLQTRAAMIQERGEAGLHRRLFANEDVSPRFILLHTLAHLLIRELESEAGYPAASLKERIYSETGPDPMAGILIYVAVPDEVGSLGGLVQLAEPLRFVRTLDAALDAALWCSLDPICSEHGGQGPEMLNRAACQACALVPEPSCQYGNIALDRTFLKGNDKEGILPLLSYVEL